MIHVFLITFSIVTATSVLCWVILFFAIPKLRNSHPAHFQTAGAPSWIRWHLLRFGFLRYLLSERLGSLTDSKLLFHLQVVKILWMTCLVAFAIMMASVFAHFGA